VAANRVAVTATWATSARDGRPGRRTSSIRPSQVAKAAAISRPLGLMVPIRNRASGVAATAAPTTVNGDRAARWAEARPRPRSTPPISALIARMAYRARRGPKSRVGQPTSAF
jgi:hypothetical protein